MNTKMLKDKRGVTVNLLVTLMIGLIIGIVTLVVIFALVKGFTPTVIGSATNTGAVMPADSIGSTLFSGNNSIVLILYYVVAFVLILGILIALIYLAFEHVQSQGK